MSANNTTKDTVSASDKTKDAVFASDKTKDAVFADYTTKDTVSASYTTKDPPDRTPILAYDASEPSEPSVCGSDMFKATRQVTEVNCEAIVKGDTGEIERAKTIETPEDATDADIAEYASDCARLRSPYHTCAYSEDELHYPIAYSILTHKDSAQVELLLRTLYQPQNVYCIHPDPKSSLDFLKAITNIASCFPNVFIASKLESIVYASFSRLQAEINCFKDLLQRKENWRYVINLTGQMFPLKTNLEVVKILKIYNGANDIKAMPKMIKSRVNKIFVVKKGKLIATYTSKTAPIPGDLELRKGSAYGVFSRDFMRFVMTNETAIAFLNWTKDTYSPDETYWQTLNHNPHLNVPGSYSGVHHKKPHLASFSAWGGEHPCHGFFKRAICIFSLADIPLLLEKKFLFANKFYLDYQPLTLPCLKEWYDNRTLTKAYFNTTYYEQLPFIHPV